MKKQIKPYARSGIIIHSVALIGHPSDKIIEFAKKKTRVDLIIMGSSSRKGIIPRIGAIGGTSRNVLETSPCPITLIH